MDISTELKIENGDFKLLAVKENLQQDENIIISSDKGKIVNNPLLGVGITKYLNGPLSILDIRAAIKNELLKDNIQVSTIEIVNGEINIKSWRK